MIVRITIFLVALACSSNSLSAQETPSLSPGPVAIPTGITEPAAATRAWLDTIRPDEEARSDAYFEGGYWLILWNFLLIAAIALLLLTPRLSARIRDVAATLTRFRPIQAGIYASGFALITGILNFPLNFYEGFVREHQYGMSNQTFRAWFGEWLSALAILYRIFQATERTWWMWGTVFGIILVTIGSMAAPVLIEPIFNKYTPLTDPKIRDPILALARANQIPVTKVFVVDQSR